MAMFFEGRFKLVESSTQQTTRVCWRPLQDFRLEKAHGKTLKGTGLANGEEWQFINLVSSIHINLYDSFNWPFVSAI